MPIGQAEALRAAVDGRTGRPLDLASWQDYLAGLGLDPSAVTRAGGRMVAGPARPIAALALRLGLGQAFLDTPHTRQILTNLGVDPGLAPIVARRLRRLDDWRPVWQDLAAPILRRAEQARLSGATAVAIEAIHTALTLLGLAYGGDGYYIFTPYAEQRAVLAVRRQLHGHLRALTGARVQRLTIVHARGATTGLLHLPSEGTGPFPTVLGLHPLAGDKDDFDTALARFRLAGFATCVIDLPAHGDLFDDQRLRAAARG
ncbi:MAG TPA: hypothetical protein PK954_24380, partial [Anaerolineales bacterium]|nr:hypothetical protein [Anaerolineales bacterium]